MTGASPPGGLPSGGSPSVGASIASIARIDTATPAEAAAELAPLFEGAPGFLARLVAARPFRSWDRLFDHARATAHAMPEPEQVELVDAHPRLGAPRHAVSAMSSREQGYERAEGSAMAGWSPMSERLATLNDAYEARFGFRYCVFVAGRPLDALVPELESALAADRGVELHRALDAVVDIAAARQAGSAATTPATRSR